MTVTPVQLAETFLDCLRRRDFDGFRSLLSSNVELRALLPGEIEQQRGINATVDCFVDWFGQSELHLLDHAVDEVPGRVRISYGFDVRDGDSHREIAQDVFCTVNDGSIERIDLVCSGFHAVAGVAAPGRYTFDAGDLGCGDGLAAEFRRQLLAVPIGSILEVVTSDPAAREDLPPLARMTGNAVLDVRNQDDGRTVVIVERKR